MSRETRLIAVLLVISAIGVTGLLIVANKYQKVLVANPAATAGRTAGTMDSTRNAARLVDGFLAARAAAWTFVSSHPEAVLRPDAHADLVDAYRVERESALAAHGMTFEEYAAVRSAWRGFRAGRSVGDAALAGAFHDKQVAVDAADLGPGEAFDSAIR